MKLISEPFHGVRVLEPFVFQDPRGLFVKTLHEDQLKAFGIEFLVKEEFYSTSAAGVVRGMHFQLPPHAHQKLIYCISGRVMDVILDLRSNSPTYGKPEAIELSATNHHVLHLPFGFAHGFLSLEDKSCLVYKTDTVHDPSADAGIRWDSFGFDWQVRSPIISARDAAFPSFYDFVSPF
jgi:dTDP-4-dehydrorhamnose 3,5-epimerase